jgi:hypothetical protein
MKKTLKNIIKKIINEVFDNLKLPKDLELTKGEGMFIYKFKTNKSNYCVLFKVYNTFSKDTSSQLAALTKDEEINDILIKNNDALFLSWGTCNNDSFDISDNVNTNLNEEIYVFNSVFAIVKNFIKEKSPNIIFYQAIKKRRLIYDKMHDKMNISNYEKIHGILNTFLIKKELI